MSSGESIAAVRVPSADTKYGAAVIPSNANNPILPGAFAARQHICSAFWNLRQRGHCLIALSTLDLLISVE